MATKTAPCNKCGKLDASKACGRCLHVYYCSRECQLSDWKIHKPKCVASTNTTLKPKSNVANATNATKTTTAQGETAATTKPTSETNGTIASVNGSNNCENGQETTDAPATTNDEKQNETTNSNNNNNNNDNNNNNNNNNNKDVVFPEYILNNEWFEIKHINDIKGYGLFAKKEIAVGTIIIREKPLLVAKDPKLVDFKDSKSLTLQKLFLFKQFSRLSGQNQSIIKSLSYFIPQTTSMNNDDSNKEDSKMNEEKSKNNELKEDKTESGKLFYIFNSNCISMPIMDNDDRRVQCGLFAIISRINHNCISNVQRCWIINDELNIKEERVIVMKTINKNEEIVTNYFENNKNSNNSNVLLPFEERKKLLKNEFNIDKCDCNWCIQCRGNDNDTHANTNDNNNENKEMATENMVDNNNNDNNNKKENNKNKKNNNKKGKNKKNNVQKNNNKNSQKLSSKSENDTNSFLLKQNEWINEYNKINDSLEQYGKTDAKEGYRQCKKLIKTIEKYYYNNPQFLYQHCYDAAQFALGLHQFDNAFYYFEKCFEYKKIANGNDCKASELEKQKALMLPQKYHRKLTKLF